jgi:hypothetical protein
MNATGEDGEGPELPVPGTPGLPLSAPVASVLQTRAPGVHRREPHDSPWSRPTGPHPAVGELPGRPPAGPTEDPVRVCLREHLDALRGQAASASSWLETSVHYARLLNRDGIVPVTARFTREDIEFLGRAREEVIGFADLGLRLLELHAPLDAGGISTDPSSPIMRCRSCMWRWPCPTFRMLTDALTHLPGPGAPSAL